MYYKNINEVEARVYQIVYKKVKRFCLVSDWFKYDRPILEFAKKSKQDVDKELILITCGCGTYLFWTISLEKPDSDAQKIYNYYMMKPESASYYYINFKTFEVRMIRNKEKFLQNILNPV